MTTLRRKEYPMREDLRIRHYIMSLIYQHPGEAFALPSSRELAEKFEVSRTTVMTALRQLRAENYIQMVHGKRSFTNPASKFEDIQPRRKPLVGILLNHGSNFYYAEREWNLQSAAGNALLAKGWNLRLLPLTGISEQALHSELKNAYVEGLLWLLPSDELSTQFFQQLNYDRIPTILLTGKHDGYRQIEDMDILFLEDFTTAQAAAEAAADLLFNRVETPTESPLC